MGQDLNKLVGICGLYCGTCPYFLAYRKNDIKYIERMSQENKCSLDELRCDGCLSDNVAAHCKDCRHGFRTCAAEKKVTWCFECDAFPCQRLKDFRGVHVVNGISHHEHVIDDLQYMKKYGVEAWVKTQDEAARCSECGEVLYWFDHECPDCKQQIERLRNES
jgi:hypothetical protein